MSKHLWECDHPYYCEPENYFRKDTTQSFNSLADFLAGEGDADMDYNLLFRWDWSEEDDEGASTYNGDDYYRNGTLSLFFMGQRKGLYRSATVSVCRADEPKVIEYLAPRWKHMQKLWEPQPHKPATSKNFTTSPAFERWWHDEGSGFPSLPGEDAEQHAKRIAWIAWRNGAFLAVMGYPASCRSPEIEGQTGDVQP